MSRQASQQSATCKPVEMQNAHLMASWKKLSIDDRAAIQHFLDQEDTATPFQDAVFCGPGALGGGLADHWFVTHDKSAISAVGYGIENFVLSRYLPWVRSLSLPKGPVAADGPALLGILRIIEQTARRRRMAHVEIQPQWIDGDVEKLRALIVDHGWIAVDATASMTLKLDLKRGLDVLFAGLDKGTRYEVRRAQRVGIDVRFAKTDNDYAKFYECYRRTGLRKGFGGLTRENFSGLVTRILREPSRGAVLTATKDDDFLGGIVVLRSGPSLHYVYGATTDRLDLRKLPIGHLLQWRAIEWGRQLGLSTYDFGGYTVASDSSVARFKGGFGGTPVQIAPKYRRILRPWIHSLDARVNALKDLHRPHLESPSQLTRG